VALLLFGGTSFDALSSLLNMTVSATAAGGMTKLPASTPAANIVLIDLFMTFLPEIH
jgi:hypothetical protein